jgi:hypothetical protein
MITMVATLEQVKITLFEIKIGDFPTGPGDKRTVDKDSIFFQFSGLFCNILHGETDMMEPWPMLLQKLSQGWMVDGTQYFDQGRPTTKGRHFDAGLPFNHSMVVQFKVEGVPEDERISRYEYIIIWEIGGEKFGYMG